jgi:hypothetical protein
MLSKRVLPVVSAIVLVACASGSTGRAPAGPAKPQLATAILFISGMT